MDWSILLEQNNIQSQLKLRPDFNKFSYDRIRWRSFFCLKQFTIFSKQCLFKNKIEFVEKKHIFILKKLQIY